MTTEEMIFVMNAYSNGKKIEFRRMNENNWNKTDLPVWDWAHFDYRVRPEPKYAPYDSVEEIDKDKWIVTKDGMAAYRIGAMDTGDDTVYLVSYDWIDLKELFEHYVYEDGTPCGKLVEA